MKRLPEKNEKAARKKMKKCTACNKKILPEYHQSDDIHDYCKNLQVLMIMTWTFKDSKYVDMKINSIKKIVDSAVS